MAAATYETTVVMGDGAAIHTTVTSSYADVHRFLMEFGAYNNLIVGLDAEWRPNFQPGGGENQIAVLQLCIGHRCLVYQIIHDVGISSTLKSFLAHPGHTFVGVGVSKDAQKLLHEYGLRVANPVDPRYAAAHWLSRPDLLQAGLKSLALAVMGANIDKPQSVTLSAWDAHVLTAAQVTYATMDAYVSYEIGRRLLSNNYHGCLGVPLWCVLFH
ncbi:hypothetical protein EJB05_17572, partial [Eragrostis curvula]